MSSLGSGDEFSDGGSEMTDIIGITFRHFRQGISTNTWIIFATDRHACIFLTNPYQLIPIRCLR